MNRESLKLYKLMIMYMLDNLPFPLTTSQLSEFIVANKYTSYFQLQQSINELVEGSYIWTETVRNTSRFHLSETGRETLSLLGNIIPDTIKKDILSYLDENKYKLREEADIIADFFPAKNGEYTVMTQIRENDSILLELNINVVSRDQAVAICDRWAEKSNDIYQMLIKALLIDEPEE